MVKVNNPANTARTVCRIVVGILAAILAAGIVACCIGCESTRPSREAVRADIAWALRIAYDVGGQAAVSNRIEQLVARGKLTREQADALHQAAQRAYEKIIDDLDPDWCPDGGCTPTNALQGACGKGGGCCTIGGDSCDGGDCYDNGGCNEDAYCGECEDCKANR